MPRRKPTPAPKKASGENIEEWQRKTVRIVLRLPPEIASMLDELRGERQRSAYVTRLVRTAAGIDPGE